MYIALLGRQPELSIAELERVYKDVTWFSAESALVKTDEFAINRLGGTQKAGRVITNLPTTNWQVLSQEIVQHYSAKLADSNSKITLGVSVYGGNVSSREVQKVGLLLKGKLRSKNVSLRLIPNQEPALSSATSHHNKLGLSNNKIEIIVVLSDKKAVIAESTGAQNISALAARDQGRPRRDAFVGMLPPKLALLLVNLATAGQANAHLLDPFCGTGVILQEAALLGHPVHGSDISEKMIDYSQQNLDWLQGRLKHQTLNWQLQIGDATKTNWPLEINAVATEAYLGQPFSAPPSAAKLAEVRKNCQCIISSFLKNLSKQIKPGTPVVVAVPAWRIRSGENEFSHLAVSEMLENAGFSRINLKNAESHRLMYSRPDQVVGREILLIIKN